MLEVIQARVAKLRLKRLRELSSFSTPSMVALYERLRKGISQAGRSLLEKVD
jgi:hypothetical protein